MKNDDKRQDSKPNSIPRQRATAAPGFFVLLVPAILASAAALTVLRGTHPVFDLPAEFTSADVQAGPGENPELKKALRLTELKNAAVVMSYAGIFLALAFTVAVRKSESSTAPTAQLAFRNMLLGGGAGAIGGVAGQMLLTHFGDTQTTIGLSSLILGHTLTFALLGIAAGVSIRTSQWTGRGQAILGGIVGGGASAILYVLAVSLSAPGAFPERLIDLTFVGQAYWFSAVPLGVAGGIGCLMAVGATAQNPQAAADVTIAESP